MKLYLTYPKRKKSCNISLILTQFNKNKAIIIIIITIIIIIIIR